MIDSLIVYMFIKSLNEYLYLVTSKIKQLDIMASPLNLSYLVAADVTGCVGGDNMLWAVQLSRFRAEYKKTLSANFQVFATKYQHNNHNNGT